MERDEVKNVLEALMFVADRPITLKEFKTVLQDDYADLDGLESILNELKSDYEVLNKPFEIKFIAEGWTFAAKAEFSPWIKKLYKRKFTFKLSASALETLAIIAYKQPVTKTDIEDIRGVDSTGVINTLLERKLIKIAGIKEVLGRPSLYGTTQEFMKHFGLSRLNDLPLIKEDLQEEKDFSDETVAEETSLLFDEENSDSGAVAAESEAESVLEASGAESQSIAELE
ncbi:MAG: SMC-Scp complex subunit ScpB, partial [Elusimicrobiota bacterium]|nr:SMC-Scp complex subunit ScpB [Elusimicrobiota bacterium]